MRPLGEVGNEFNRLIENALTAEAKRRFSASKANVGAGARRRVREIVDSVGTTAGFSSARGLNVETPPHSAPANERRPA